MEFEIIIALIFGTLIFLGLILQMVYFFQDKRIKSDAFTTWQEQRKNLTDQVTHLIGSSPNIDDTNFTEVINTKYNDLKIIVSHGEHPKYKSHEEIEILYQRIIECQKAEQLLREKYRVTGVYRGNDNLKKRRM